jgi:hypothetical protein
VAHAAVLGEKVGCADDSENFTARKIHNPHVTSDLAFDPKPVEPGMHASGRAEHALRLAMKRTKESRQLEPPAIVIYFFNGIAS